MTEEHQAELDEDDDDYEDEPDPTPGRLSRQQAAKFLGCSTHTIRRYEREGRLTSITQKGKKAYFKLEDVQEIGGMRKEQDRLALPPAAAAEQARANAITDMVASANSHSEEFAKLLRQVTNDALKSKDETMKMQGQHQLQIIKAFQNENERLTNRIEFLEKERQTWLAVLEEQRKADYENEERKERRAMILQMFNEGKTFAKALMAAKLPQGGDKSAMQTSTFDDFLATLTPDQQMSIMMTLTADQQAMLFAIKQSAEKTQETT